MRWFWACGVGVAIVVVACGDDGGSGLAPIADAGNGSEGGSSSGALSDAGADVFDAGPVVHTIAIHVTSPPTWAVRQADDGMAWVAFEPKGADAGTSMIGEYEITTTSASFTVAFACADDNRSLVSVLTRASTITDLDVVLAPQCATQDAEPTTLTGTFSGLGADTGWLDFGYALEMRGAVFPTSGGSGDYELVNLASGTRDLAFGFRDDFGKPFTKLLIARDLVLAEGAATFSSNVGTNGVTPGKQKLSLAGMNNEQTHVSVLYAMSGATTGIELGPANDPDNAATADVDYPTLPSSTQRASDHYRITALTVEDATSTRGGTAVFHDAADLRIELPDALDVPTAFEKDTSVVTRMRPRPDADVYEATVFTRITNQSSVEWRVSTSASLVTANGNPSDIELAPPDFSAVAGFKTAWLTPLDLAHVVTAAIHEKQLSVGDGKLDRIAQRSITLD